MVDTKYFDKLLKEVLTKRARGDKYIFRFSEPISKETAHYIRIECAKRDIEVSTRFCSSCKGWDIQVVL